MAMVEDEWIRSAMVDVSVPAEMLIRLKQSYSSKRVKMSPGIVLSPRWGHRQPRSRPVSRCDADSPRKDGKGTRCSPTTPFSWSSQSTIADGFEASSLLKNCFPVSRSKTFVELKEKENILLKERIHLEKELAALRASFMEQTAKNEHLKKLKVEHSLKTTAFIQYKQASSTSSQAPPLLFPTHTPSIQQYNSFQVQKSEAAKKRRFVLPDLNMAPSENDFQTDSIYGMS